MALKLDDKFGVMGSSSSNTKLWISKIKLTHFKHREYTLVEHGNFGYMDKSLNVFNGAGYDVTDTIEELAINVFGDIQEIIFFDENGIQYDETTLDELRLGYKVYIEGLKI